MLTVTISINGRTIFARSAVNKGETHEGYVSYLVDDGSVVFHKPEDGAVALSKMLLDLIKEQTHEPLSFDALNKAIKNHFGEVRDD